MMIEAFELSKTYGRHIAVNSVSFSVPKGRIIGFLGPNGAGKTTTLRMLTGYLPATKGAASIAGYDIFTQTRQARARLGYMPENVPLYEDMRVREYLSYRGVLKGLGIRENRRALGRSLELCGLSHVRKKMIKTLSKGYRQRVGLADALLHQPDLLILDEPTNGLDPNQIRSIRRLIANLAGEHTVLLSTHILSEVEMLCNGLIILDEGKVKAQGTPEELLGSMRRAGRISVELRGEGDFLEALRGLNEVKKVTLEGVSQEGWQSFSLLVFAGTDTRVKIAELCHAQGWQLRELHRHQTTLEELFVELTRRN